MLYNYLTEHYDEAEPIFFADVPAEGISRSALNQQLGRLCEEKRLMKYETGIYYLPKKSRLRAQVGVNADIVAKYKYISRMGQTFGFYSGLTFANHLGLTTQVPMKQEITSNNMAARVREVQIGGRSFVVRKSTVGIHSGNVHVLQMLDLLKNLDVYIEDDYDTARECFYRYIRAHHIRKSDVDEYIREYPVNVFRFYYELRLDDVLA